MNEQRNESMKAYLHSSLSLFPSQTVKGSGVGVAQRMKWRLTTHTSSNFLTLLLNSATAAFATHSHVTAIVQSPLQ
jgi:type VI protein secretion system component VasA